MVRQTRITMIALAVALLIPGAAFAQGGAVDNYKEQPPSAGGNNDPSSSGDGGGGDGNGGGSDGSAGGGPLASDTVRSFESQSSDGVRAAETAQATAPDSKALQKAAKSAQSDSSSGGSDETDTDGTADISDSPAFAALDPTGSSDGDGIGLGLPLLLGAALVAAIAFAATRAVRRRRG